MLIIKYLLNIIRTLFGYVYTAICCVLSLTSAPLNFSVPNRFANFWIRHWAWTLRLITGMKLTVIGSEYLKGDQPCVFISNHQSLMDIIVLFTITSNNLRMVVKKELLYIPIFGWSLWWTRFISIDRGKRRKALRSIYKGAEKIRKGTSVLLFPEGTRSSDGVLKPFQAGSFIMAIKSQVPIIPITISGTINVVHKKSPFKFHFNKEVKVIVSPPIDTTKYKLEDRDELKDEVESIIRSNYEKIKHLSSVCE